MVPVWLNATLELQFYNLKELPIYKDGIPELPFYKEGHHFIKMFLINWLYPGSVSNYKFDVLVHFFLFSLSFLTATNSVQNHPVFAAESLKNKSLPFGYDAATCCNEKAWLFASSFLYAKFHP